MYNKIMVPLDGSPFSELALPLAVAKARANGAELRLVHVIVPIAYSAFIEEDGAAQDYLDGIAHRINKESGVAVSAVRLSGQAVPELRDYAVREGIDLVVMATHGWGGIQRAWLGSVTDELIREARLPVLAFRPAKKKTSPVEPGTIDEILVPLDGSDLSESVLEYALELGSPSTRYTLLRVVPVAPPTSVVSGVIEQDPVRKLLAQLQSGAADYLDKISEELRAKGHEVRTRVLTHPQPAKAILDYAVEIEADVIALATEGRHGFRRLTLGSVADKVLRGADSPVLVIRGDGADADE
jgi:nucleotide-binding universal stress UspA family protein